MGGSCGRGARDLADFLLGERAESVEVDLLLLVQKRAADVLGDLIARLGLGEVAELFVEHAFELKANERER